MVKANNFKGAYDALNQLASQGNAQALYNLGYLTQTGQGTTKDEKKPFSSTNRQPAKVIRWRIMYWVKLCSRHTRTQTGFDQSQTASGTRFGSQI